jgi:hypothetical protein
MASSWYSTPLVAFAKGESERLLKKGSVGWIALKTRRRGSCSEFGAQPELLLLGARLAKLERRCALLLPLMLLLDVDDDRGEARKRERRDGNMVWKHPYR